MSFARFAKLAFWVTFAVVLAGSIVRSTGSGMGCPDWPKCFGSWIPPTDASGIPEGYDSILATERVEKTEKFATQLESIGLDGEAEKLRQAPEVREEHPFNTAQTWTEYINRLVGFLAGNFALICLLWALFRRKGWKLISLCASIVILIGFQAWFGSIVVATNLVPWTISVHMVLALLILGLQLLLVRNLAGWKSVEHRTYWGVALLLVVFQMWMGLLIRQQVDPMLHEIARGEIVEKLDWSFLVHRSFSWAILLWAAWGFWRNRKSTSRLFHITFLAMVVLEIIVGVTLDKMGLPAAAQPFHLAFGMLLVLYPYSKLIGTGLFRSQENLVPAE